MWEYGDIYSVKMKDNLLFILKCGNVFDIYIGPFVKMGCCQTAQNGPTLKIFWSELFIIGLRVTG